jgi:hypothetical protein
MELEALFNAVIVKPIEAEENTYGSIGFTITALNSASNSISIIFYLVLN